MTGPPRCLGVLGGMGPLAAAQFAMQVAKLTPATRDQEHIPLLLCNDPRIPDRSAAMVSAGPSPLAAMLRGLRLLETSGADCIAIPCNTAHLWFDALRAASRARLLHIVESVLRDLARRGVRGGPVGVLGTRATLDLGLYQRALTEAGYEVVTPSDADIAVCAEAIAAVKSNRIADAFAPAARSIAALHRRGARAVVLGCTELPMAVPARRRVEFELVLTDSIDALARHVVEVFRPEAALVERV